MANKPVLFAIDDDPEVLRAVERDLRRRYARGRSGDGYRVLRANSADSALDTLGQLKLRGDTVALFLVDQRMPRTTGVEFLEETRDLYPEAKKVLLTAYAEDFMGSSVYEGLTVGYTLALTQFLMVLVLGIWYLRRADKVFDPLEEFRIEV